jgi:hypothetical protein
MITTKGVFGIVQGHANRHLAIEPKTGALFVGVGSSGNIGGEPEVKATIQRFEPDGSGQTTYASGMRNPTSLAFHPDTDDPYAVVQERDGSVTGMAIFPTSVRTRSRDSSRCGRTRCRQRQSLRSSRDCLI